MNVASNKVLFTKTGRRPKSTHRLLFANSWHRVMQQKIECWEFRIEFHRANSLALSSFLCMETKDKMLQGIASNMMMNW